MSKLRRVVCTGLGTVCPLGVGVKSSWSALLAGKSGVTSLKEDHSFPGGQSKVAGYVPEHQIQIAKEDPKHHYLIKNSKQLSRATTFAMIAAHEALEDSSLLQEPECQIPQEYRHRCGISVGQGMVDFQDIYENGNLVMSSDDKAKGFRKMSPFFMTRALINMSAGNISIRYKLHGPNHCVSTACATGAHSIGDSFNFIRNNQADVMICGSTEASLNSIAMAGFERLRALCTKFNDDPSAASRPFDDLRCGFVMSEGAGILVLEELEHALSRGLKKEDIYCEILGYGVSSDSSHLTAPSPDGLGAKICMKSALKSANLNFNLIGHVNAHATSTAIGDDIEYNAIREIFGEATITSLKSSFGHLLGAAGSVESIFAILSSKEAVIPHTLNQDKPHDAIVSGKPRTWLDDRRILIKNSFGFGGTNASIVISNYRE